MDLLRDLLLAAVGPLGIYLGWWLPRRDKAEDRQEKQLELRRSKAEEIYREIELATLEVQRATSQAAHLLKPDDATLEPMVTSLGKLRGLVAIYFPNGNNLFADHDKSEIGIGQWLRTQLQSGPNNSLPDADAIRGITFGYVTQVQAANRELLSKLRISMDTEVQTLT